MANTILYGVANQKDLAAHLVAQNIIVDIDPDIVVASVVETVQQHNAEINALREVFAKPTTDFQLGYKGVLANDLQEGDENQNPEAVKGGVPHTVGFPLRIAGTKWGANYTTLEQMTVEDFSDRTEQMLIGDVNWNRKWTLATLLFDGNNGTPGVTNGLAAGTAPYVWNDPKQGLISVYGLANGDAVTYNKFSAAAGETDSHYTAQNGAISDSTGQNPFPGIETDLVEHPENAGPYVSFIDTALATTVKALASFVPIPLNIAVPGPGSTAPVLNTLTIPGVQLPPNAVYIGTIGQLHIVTWPSIPTGIIITRAFGAPPALLFRQFPNANLQGFAPVGFARSVAGSVFGTKFPYFESVWYRAGGFGAYNRVGASVHQVASSTTYAMPSAYFPLLGRTS